MSCKTYRLYTTTTTGSTSNLASVRMNIPAGGNGVIRSINFALAGTGGAGVGFIGYEISKANALQNSNDAQNTIAHAQMAVGNATTASSNSLVVTECPVKDGDYIYLHSMAQTGTALANVVVSIDVIVEQPGA